MRGQDSLLGFRADNIKRECASEFGIVYYATRDRGSRGYIELRGRVLEVFN